MELWRDFENLKLAVKQCYQTGQFNRTKIGGKCQKFKNSNATFWVIFFFSDFGCNEKRIGQFRVEWGRDFGQDHVIAKSPGRRQFTSICKQDHQECFECSWHFTQWLGQGSFFTQLENLDSKSIILTFKSIKWQLHSDLFFNFFKQFFFIKVNLPFGVK